MTNSFVISGNLTRDPLFFEGDKDKKDRAVFTVAVSRWGESEDSDYFDVTVFGYQARNAVESLAKGSPVVASGYMTTYKKPVQIDGKDINMTMVGFTATEIGHSLRFGTVEYTKRAGTGTFMEPEPVPYPDEVVEEPRAQRAPAKNTRARQAAPKRAPARQAPPASDFDDFGDEPEF